MGRPRKKERSDNVTYNVSTQIRDRLHTLKQKGENQNDVIKRLLSEYEEIQSLKQELADCSDLVKDDGMTMIELRKKIADLEIKLKELNHMDIMSIFPRVF